MKKFLRWNRGLLLAALCVTGVILFQAFDQARFQRSIPAISHHIQDYLTNTSAALTNETDPAKASSAFLQTLEQFWGSSSQRMHYSQNKSDFYSYLPLPDDASYALPLALDIQVTSCKIQKSGPGVCTALVTYNQKAYLDQYGSFISPFYMDYAYDPSSDMEDETPASVKEGREVICYTSTEQVSLRLDQKEGQWKITTASLCSSYGESVLVKTSEVPV